MRPPAPVPVGPLIGLVILCWGCWGCRPAAPASAPPAAGPPAPVSAVPLGRPALSLFVTGQVHNATEPCGCTSEPLGDVARLVRMMKGLGWPAQLLDAGGLRYSGEVLAAERLRQDRLKADFLEQTFRGLRAVMGIQPEDLYGGLEELRGDIGWRVAANLGGLPLRPGALVIVGGVRVGVLGIAAPPSLPGIVWPAGIEIGDPVAAARTELAWLRQRGAELVVALTGLPRPAARRLARAVPGLDMVVAGGGLTDEGIEDAERAGTALLVAPARELKRVVRLDLHLSSKGGPMAFYKDPRAQRREEARLLGQQQVMEEQLARLQKDPSADPAFVRSTREELLRIGKELQAARQPAVPPAGSYLTMELLPLRRCLPRDPEVARALAQLDRRIAEENLALARQKPRPPPPPPGQPVYVGVAGCLGKCHYHEEALAQWKKTVHAQAWQTLVDSGKPFSLDCVGCHAVGFGEPGGATLLSLAQGPELRAIQCETCHGAGSLHVAAPVKKSVPVPKPGKERCQACHTPEHSDTFDYQAYLRDILGPGHGPEARQALGPGRTGHELRQAALKKHQDCPELH